MRIDERNVRAHRGCEDDARPSRLVERGEEATTCFVGERLSLSAVRLFESTRTTTELFGRLLRDSRRRDRIEGSGRGIAGRMRASLVEGFAEALDPRLEDTGRCKSRR